MAGKNGRVRRLRVGVTTRHGSDAWVAKNTHNYLDVLATYDVEAVVLAPDTAVTLLDGVTLRPDAQGRLPAETIGYLDGLILSGGGDVHPQYFGQVLDGADPDTIDLKRDELELGLARQALAADLPLFGICRGCQVLNVAAGGAMVQDFPGHRSDKEKPTLHDVAIRRESRLYRLTEAASLSVNTYHHQGVDTATLAPVFAVSAIAQPDTWLIEAYESPTHRWVFGIQWHPERLFELPDAHRRLWDSFLAACGQTP